MYHTLLFNSLYFFIPVRGFLYNKQYMKSLMEGCRGKKMTKSGLYIKK